MQYNSTLKIPIQGIVLEGQLAVPTKAAGLVIFSHGSGSSRFSPRNSFIAQQLQRRGIATLLFDLLTKEEDEIYSHRFNIELLSARLEQVTKWVKDLPQVEALPIGYFGASTGAACALVAASQLPDTIQAVVSRGGRPDLALNQLYRVNAPTLLIVGENDLEVMTLNQEAFEKLTCLKSLQQVKGATHLFEEPGTMEEVARLAGDWFVQYLATPRASVRTDTDTRR
jgi:putative phosphoribosyl transferase